MDLVSILKRVELFHDLNDAQLARVAAISTREVYDEGDVIVQQDTPGDKMYIISAGQVVVGRAQPNGSLDVLLFLGTGQIFGEVALLDQGVRSASVAADQAGTVVQAVTRDAFLNLCRADTALGFTIMKNLATDLAFKLRHRNADAAAADNG